MTISSPFLVFPNVSPPRRQLVAFSSGDGDELYRQAGATPRLQKIGIGEGSKELWRCFSSARKQLDGIQGRAPVVNFKVIGLQLPSSTAKVELCINFVMEESLRGSTLKKS